MCIMYKCIHSHWCSVSDEFVQNVCMYYIIVCTLVLYILFSILSLYVADTYVVMSLLRPY